MALDSRPAGTLIKYTELPVRFWPEHTYRAYRIFYQGVGFQGRGRLVTGSVFVPPGQAPEGGWPVVGYAHGTCGLADKCAPSRTGFYRLEKDFLAGWLRAGYAVAATDYEGLGTPGPHPYLDGHAAADDVVDAVRAARHLSPQIGHRWLAVGYSQGGHAALHVAGMATRYAPELHLCGTVALSPVSHLVEHAAAKSDRPDAQASPILPYILAGMRTLHPGYEPGDRLTADGNDLLDLAERVGLTEMMRTTRHLSTGQTGATGITDDAGLRAALEEHEIPDVAIDRPVFLAHGEADRSVEVHLSDRLAGELRASECVLDYRRYPGADHLTILAAALGDCLTWASGVTTPTGPR